MLIFTTEYSQTEVTIQLRAADWSRLVDALSRQIDTVRLASFLRPVVARDDPMAVVRIRVTLPEYQAIRRIAARLPA